MTLQEILAKLDRVSKTASGHQARCPAHDDREPSLSISQGEKGVVLFCHAGCETRQIAAALGFQVKDLFDEPLERPHINGNGHKGRIVASYDYRDEAGSLLFQSVRFDPKRFTQRRPDGDGEWLWNLKDTRRVLYRLPELLASDADDYVFLPEGEKDADRLIELGLVATTNPMGAGKWRDEYCASLKGRAVILLPDNDEPGEKHAAEVERSLARHGGDVTVRILRLPGLAPKGDVSDWLDAGGTAEQLRDLAEAVLTRAVAEPEPEIERAEPQYWRQTQEGLAAEFLKRYGHNLRYVQDLAGDLRGDHFVWWNGQRWQFRAGAVAAVAGYQREMTGEFRDYAKELLESVGGSFDDLDKPDKASVTFSKTIEAHGFKAGWKDEVKGHGAIHINVTDFDSDPFLLNCRNGTLDLRTGEMRGYRRSDYLSRSLDIAYDPKAKTDLWLAFLRRIFAENETLIGYIRRVIGYCLTGDTSEQCLFLLHGSGQNGKSVLLEVVSAMLGDFAQASPMQTFTAKPNDSGSSNDLARMRGARLVTASETNDGVRLNEALIKKVTGQDKITARFLYSEFFDYLPQFKLWLAMNHKPIIRGQDYGIWRRIRLIPFGVTIPEDERDRQLADKLKRELPGILAWAVEGCLEWQRDGAQTPEEVSAATEGYRSEQDILGAFIEEKCTVGPDFYVGATDLYRAYKRWSEDASEHPMSQTKFGRQMSDRGFKSEHSYRGNIRTGIGLLTEP